MAKDISSVKLPAEPLGELVVYYAQYYANNADASMRYAMSRAKKGEGVLYFNTCMTERQLSRLVTSISEGKMRRDFIFNMEIFTSPLGELGYKRDVIGAQIEGSDGHIQHIVINSWEFAAKDTRSRNTLLHTLLYLVSAFNIRVTIFCQNGEGAVVGKLQQGRLGRLTIIADEISPTEKLLGQLVGEQEKTPEQKKEPILEAGITSIEPSFTQLHDNVIQAKREAPHQTEQGEDVYEGALLAEAA